MNRDDGNKDMPLYKWLITDLNILPEDIKHQLLNFIGDREIVYVNNTNNQIIVSVDSKDEKQLVDLIKKTLVSVFHCYYDAHMLSLILAKRQTYFREDNGKMEVLPIFAPIMLVFFILNASPALANHLTSGIKRIVSAEKYNHMVDIYISDNGITVNRLLIKDNSDKDHQGIERGSVQHFCEFNGSETIIKGYGDFPELDNTFLSKLEVYERRLCVRKHVQALDKKYLYHPENKNIENDIIERAYKCGYSDEVLFSQFVYVYLVMGIQEFELASYYVCDPSDEAIKNRYSSVGFGEQRTDRIVKHIDEYGIRIEDVNLQTFSESVDLIKNDLTLSFEEKKMALDHVYKLEREFPNAFKEIEAARKEMRERRRKVRNNE